MQLILGVPSTREVKREPITISDDEEQATTHPTLSLKDRENDILAKFDVINHQLNSKWPTSSQDFRQVIIDYQERFVTRFKKPTRVSQEEKIKIVENHWFMDLTLLGEWINILRIQENVEELLKTVEDATGLQTENDFKTLILFVPSSSTPWQNKIMAAMESCENPLIDTEDSSDENLFHSEHWQRVESNRKLVLKHVREFADHVMENKETKPPIKFTIQRTDNDQDLNCHFSLYEAGNLVKDKFDRLPAAPTTVTINPEIVDGKTEIKWNYEDADPNNFLVRYRKLPQDVWTEEKIINPVFTFRPGPALEFCVAVDTLFGRSKFSPVIQVPELLQQAKPVVKQITHNTVELEWPPQPNGAISYHLRCKESQLAGPFTQEDIDTPTCWLEGLLPETTYTVCIVAVFPDGQEMRCAPSESIQFTTLKKCFAQNMMARCQKIGSHNDLDLYAVPLDGPTTSNNVERYVFNEANESFTSSGPSTNELNKTVVLLGATNESKAPLINAMINYIFDVNFEDKFRFQLVEDIQQTESVKIYKIRHAEGFRIPHSLTIVDIAEDAKFLEDVPGPDMVRQLIESEHGIEEVELLSIMFQPWQFNAALSVFGNDVRENANFIATDSQLPDVENDFEDLFLHTIKSEDYFQSNRRADLDQVQHYFEIFFTQLATMKTTSLAQTKSVLEDRKRVEAALDELQSLIINGIAKKEKVRDAQENVRTIKNKINEMENKLNKKNDCRPVTVQEGQNVVNCRKCRVTCNPSVSYTFWGFTPNCRVCPGKCKSESHFTATFKWEQVPLRDLAEIKLKLASERNSLQAAQERVAELEKEVIDIEKSVEERVDFLYRGILKLNANGFCNAGYSSARDIMTIINAEIEKEEPGFEGRIEMLKRNCLRSEIVSKIHDTPSVLALMA